MIARILGAFASASLAVFAFTGCSSAEREDEIDEMAVGALAQFHCGAAPSVKDVPNAPYGQVVAVRSAGHAGYDRFVMEFSPASGVPNYRVARQRGATFYADGSGDPIQLPGTAGISLIAQMASGWDWEASAPSFSGPSRFRPQGTKVVTEAALTGDFEGQVGWGLGLERQACYRVFELTNPPRLVVDVQNDGPTPDAAGLPPEPPLGYTCETAQVQSIDHDAGLSKLAGVRAAGHPDFDRFVMEFAPGRPVPSYTVTRQNSATFSRYGEGTLQLEGNAGLVVNVFTLENWMETDQVGPSRFRPNGTSVLREAGMTYAFEGHVEWALGLSETSCYKVYTLNDPPRLVVDVQK